MQRRRACVSSQVAVRVVIGFQDAGLCRFVPCMRVSTRSLQVLAQARCRTDFRNCHRTRRYNTITLEDCDRGSILKIDQHINRKSANSRIKACSLYQHPEQQRSYVHRQREHNNHDCRRCLSRKPCQRRLLTCRGRGHPGSKSAKHLVECQPPERYSSAPDRCLGSPLDSSQYVVYCANCVHSIRVCTRLFLLIIKDDSLRCTVGVSASILAISMYPRGTLYI
ncbi:hypothetical protein BDN72DRAFT_373739 [Pluteus cervinus]|uniref:Uncharacterized protein n=1 Tax=Pluteus cervinus TaxID=181527 RepID=A0ACD3B2K1_9AGAR|nr:hypothetical protein BDN72DRAFT_373739 [Pluteus cervinus]